MKQFLIIYFIFISSVFANNTEYKIVYRDGTTETVEIKLFEKDGGITLKNGNKIDANKIDSIKLHINDKATKNIVLINNYGDRQYLEGVIAFRDLKKFTIIDDKDSLNIFKTEQVDKIVNREYFYKQKSKNRNTALALSSIYPGEGQKYNERPILGYSLFVSSLYLGYMSVKNYTYTKDNYKHYKNSMYLDIVRYNKHKNYANLTNKYITLFSIVYLFNLYDSYYNFVVVFPEEPYIPVNNKEIKTNISYTIPINW